MAVWELTVTGRVQGVVFRWYAKHLALELGVKGYIRNLPDGSVRILAQADQLTLERFGTEVRMGNRHALVAEVHIMTLDHASEYYDFEIR